MPECNIPFYWAVENLPESDFNVNLKYVSEQFLSCGKIKICRKLTSVCKGIWKYAFNEEKD
jgi:hypothetical protein